MKMNIFDVLLCMFHKYYSKQRSLSDFQNLGQEHVAIGAEIGVSVFTICSILMLVFHGGGYDVVHPMWLEFAIIMVLFLGPVVISVLHYRKKDYRESLYAQFGPYYKQNKTKYEVLFWGLNFMPLVLLGLFFAVTLLIAG